MKIKFWYIPALFFIIIILQVLGTRAGLLDPSQKIIWYDNVMHALAGVLSGIFVIWAVNKEKRNLNKKQFFWAIIIVALIMAVLWELFELGMFKIIKDYSLMNQPYTTSFGEAMLDSLSNTAGATILAIRNYFGTKE